MQVNFKSYQKVPVKNLITAEWNYKKKDEELQKTLVNNIKKNGQIENIIVREIGDGKMEVINGNHRLEAFKTLKTKFVMVYNLGEVELEEAQRIAIETNETKFGTDNLKLENIFSNLQDSFDDLSDTISISEKFQKHIEEKSKEPSKKSRTAISVSGETYKTIKLELNTELAELFEDQLSRFKKYSNNSSDKPIEFIVNFLKSHSDEEIIAYSRKKKTKKMQ